MIAPISFMKKHAITICQDRLGTHIRRKYHHPTLKMNGRVCVGGGGGGGRGGGGAPRGARANPGGGGPGGGKRGKGPGPPPGKEGIKKNQNQKTLKPGP